MTRDPIHVAAVGDPVVSDGASAAQHDGCVVTLSRDDQAYASVHECATRLAFAERIAALKGQGRKAALLMLDSENGELRFVTLRIDG